MCAAFGHVDAGGLLILCSLHPAQKMAKGPQRQKSGIAGDLSAGKISVNGLMPVEGENQLWYTVCHSWMLRKGVLGS
jgi:hypothetical protein